MNDELRKKINIANDELFSASRLGDKRQKAWWHGYRAALIDIQKELTNDVQK